MEPPRPRYSANAVGRFAPFLLVVVSAALFAGVLSSARAADPPQPDFFWPYGRAQLGAANIDPAAQTVIGLVNGRACGEAQTLIAQAGPGVPVGDVGKTVYVVDVLADGSNSGQRPGCGRIGDSVLLYFAGSHRIAEQQPLFTVGGQRVDADLGPELLFRLQGPMVASDGGN